MGILYIFSMSSETMQFIFSVIVCTTILVSIIPTLKENPNEKIDELKMEILKNSGYSAFKSIMMFLVTITFYSILVKSSGNIHSERELYQSILVTLPYTKKQPWNNSIGYTAKLIN